MGAVPIVGMTECIIAVGDEDGNVLPGAEVTLRGSSQLTRTIYSGTFSLRNSLFS